MDWHVRADASSPSVGVRPAVARDRAGVAFGGAF